MVAGTFIWKRYILAVLGMTGLVDLGAYLSPSERMLPSSDIIYPKVVEGFNWSTRNPLERYFADTSLYLPLNILHIPNERGILLIGFVMTMVFLLLCVLKYPLREKNARYLFLFGTLMSLISEFFIPIARYPYYDIQMILPLLIVVSEADTDYLTSRKINIVLVTGLLLSTVGFVVVPKALFFSAFLIAFYTVAISISILRRASKDDQRR